VLAAKDKDDEDENKNIFMHRDLRPSKLLFHQGKVKLADFGVAKLIAEVQLNNTITGAAKGLTYKSP